MSFFKSIGANPFDLEQDSGSRSQDKNFFNALEALRARTFQTPSVPTPPPPTPYYQQAPEGFQIKPSGRDPDSIGFAEKATKGLASAIIDFPTDTAAGAAQLAGTAYINPWLKRLQEEIDPSFAQFLYTLGMGDDTVAAMQQAEIDSLRMGKGAQIIYDPRRVSLVNEMADWVKQKGYDTVGIDAEIASTWIYKGANAVGQIIPQLVASVGANMIIPGSGPLLFMASAYPREFREQFDYAMDNGAHPDEAVGTASRKAAVATALESLSMVPLYGAVSKIGTAGVAATGAKFVGKSGPSLVKRKVLKVLQSAFGEGAEEYFTGVYADVDAKNLGQRWAPNKSWREIFISPQRMEEFVLGAIGGGVPSIVLTDTNVTFTPARKASAKATYETALRNRYMRDPNATVDITIPDSKTFETMFRVAEKRVHKARFLNTAQLQRQIEAAKLRVENGNLSPTQETIELLHIDGLHELMPHARRVTEERPTRPSRDPEATIPGNAPTDSATAEAIRNRQRTNTENDDVQVGSNDEVDTANEQTVRNASAASDILKAVRTYGLSIIPVINEAVASVEKKLTVNSGVPKKGLTAWKTVLNQIKRVLGAFDQMEQEDQILGMMRQEEADVLTQLAAEQVNAGAIKTLQKLQAAWPNEASRSKAIARLLSAGWELQLDTGHRIPATMILSAMADMPLGVPGLNPDITVREAIGAELERNALARNTELEKQISDIEKEAEKGETDEQKRTLQERKAQFQLKQQQFKELQENLKEMLAAANMASQLDQFNVKQEQLREKKELTDDQIENRRQAQADNEERRKRAQEERKKADAERVESRRKKAQAKVDTEYEARNKERLDRERKKKAELDAKKKAAEEKRTAKKAEVEKRKAERKAKSEENQKKKAEEKAARDKLRAEKKVEREKKEAARKAEVEANKKARKEAADKKKAEKEASNKPRQEEQKPLEEKTEKGAPRPYDTSHDKKTTFYLSINWFTRQAILTKFSTAKEVIEYLANNAQDPADFVAARLLERFGKLLGNVGITWVDEPSLLPKELVNAYANEGRVRAFMRKRHIYILGWHKSGEPVANRTLVHEIIHAVVSEIQSTKEENLKNLSPAEYRFVQAVDNLHTDAVLYAERLEEDGLLPAGWKMNEGALYGLKNPNEFIAEALTNPEFQKFLAGIPTTDLVWYKDAVGQLGSLTHKVKSVWDALKVSIYRLLGFAPTQENAFEATLDEFGELLSSPEFRGLEYDSPFPNVFNAETNEKPIRPDIPHVKGEIRTTITVAGRVIMQRAKVTKYTFDKSLNEWIIHYQTWNKKKGEWKDAKKLPWSQFKERLVAHEAPVVGRPSSIVNDIFGVEETVTTSAGGAVGITPPPMTWPKKAKYWWGKTTAFLAAKMYILYTHGGEIKARLGELGDFIWQHGMLAERRAAQAMSQHEDDVDRQVEYAKLYLPRGAGHANTGNFAKWFKIMLGAKNIDQLLADLYSVPADQWTEENIALLEEAKKELGFNPATALYDELNLDSNEFTEARIKANDGVTAARKELKRLRQSKSQDKRARTKAEQELKYWVARRKYLDRIFRARVDGRYTHEKAYIMKDVNSVSDSFKFLIPALQLSRYHDDRMYDAHLSSTLDDIDQGFIPNHVFEGVSEEFGRRISNNDSEFQAERQYVIDELRKEYKNDTKGTLARELGISETNDKDVIEKAIALGAEEILRESKSSLWSRKSHKFAAYFKKRKGAWGVRVTDWSYNSVHSFLDKASRQVSENNFLRQFITELDEKGGTRWHPKEDYVKLNEKGESQLPNSIEARELLFHQALSPAYSSGETKNVEVLRSYLDLIRGREFGFDRWREVAGWMAKYQYATKLTGLATLIRNFSILGSLGLLYGPQNTWTSMKMVAMDPEARSRANRAGVAPKLGSPWLEMDERRRVKKSEGVTTAVMATLMFPFSAEEKFMRRVSAHAALFTYRGAAQFLQSGQNEDANSILAKMGLTEAEALANLKDFFYFTDEQIEKIRNGTLSREEVIDFEDQAMLFGSQTINFRSGPNYIPSLISGHHAVPVLLRVFNSFAYNILRQQWNLIWKYGYDAIATKDAEKAKIAFKRGLRVYGGAAASGTAVAALISALDGGDDEDDLKGNNGFSRWLHNRFNDFATCGLFGKIERPLDILDPTQFLGGVHVRSAMNFTRAANEALFGVDDLSSGRVGAAVHQEFSALANLMVQEIGALRSARDLYLKQNVSYKDYVKARDIGRAYIKNKMTLGQRFAKQIDRQAPSRYRKERDALVRELASGDVYGAAVDAKYLIQRYLAVDPEKNVKTAVQSARASVMFYSPLGEISRTTDPAAAAEDLKEWAKEHRERRGSDETRRLVAAHMAYVKAVNSIFPRKTK